MCEKVRVRLQAHFESEVGPRAHDASRVRAVGRLTRHREQGHSTHQLPRLYHWGRESCAAWFADEEEASETEGMEGIVSVSKRRAVPTATKKKAVVAGVKVPECPLCAKVMVAGDIASYRSPNRFGPGSDPSVFECRKNKHYAVWFIGGARRECEIRFTGSPIPIAQVQEIVEKVQAYLGEGEQDCSYDSSHVHFPDGHTEARVTSVRIAPYVESCPTCGTQLNRRRLLRR